MSHKYSLPPDIYLALSQAVADAVDSALARRKPGRSPSARTITLVTNSIGDCFQAAIFAAKRSYNALFSRQAQLPPELWALIWQFLPVKDCIAVSHVCYTWRQNAVSCPILWRSINIISKVCVCQGCLHNQEMRAFDRACDGLSPAYPLTNIPLIPTLLRRGRQMPLSLDVRIVIDGTSHLLDTRMVKHLATTLAPHTSRIRDAIVSIPASSVICQFFEKLERLPELIDLAVICAPTALQRSKFWPSGKSLSLLRLQTLKLSKDLQWPEHKLELHAMRELECTFTNVPELQRIIASCPKLESWTIRAPFHRITNPQVHPVVAFETSWIAQHISTLKLLEVDSNHLEALLSLFGDAARRHLGIVFETVGQSAHAERALQILAHCTTVVCLTVYHAKGLTTLSLTEVSGRIRTIEYPSPSPDDAILPRVWASLAPTATVCAVAATLNVWPLLCRPQPNLARLLELQVVVDAPVEALRPVSLGLPLGAPLVCLRTVTIHVQCSEITLPVAWLCSLLQGLRLPHVLPGLKVPNTSIVGPLELLRGLVLSVTDAQRADMVITAFPVSLKNI